MLGPHVASWHAAPPHGLMTTSNPPILPSLKLLLRLTVRGIAHKTLWTLKVLLIQTLLHFPLSLCLCLQTWYPSRPRCVWLSLCAPAKNISTHILPSWSPTLCSTVVCPARGISRVSLPLADMNYSFSSLCAANSSAEAEAQTASLSEMLVVDLIRSSAFCPHSEWVYFTNWDDAVKYFCNNELPDCMKTAGTESVHIGTLGPHMAAQTCEWTWLWMWNSVSMKSSMFILLGEPSFKTQSERLKHVSGQRPSGC